MLGLSCTIISAVRGMFFFDEERFEKDQHIKHVQSKVSGLIRDFADQFDKLFNQEEI